MRILRVFKAELFKYLSEMKAYYPDQIVSIIVTIIFFVGFFLGLSNETNGEFLYIGFFYWFLSSTIISEGSISISDEKQTGTFEQLLLKPVSLFEILMVRTTIWLLFSIIKMLIIIPVISLFLDINIVLNLEMLLIFVITIIGLYGFGLFLSSLTLLYTKTASFESIISYIFLFFSGSIIALDKMPTIIKYIANILPLTSGINLSVESINGSIGLLDYVVLGTTSITYLIVGLVVFVIAQKIGKSKGYSARY